MSGSYGASPRLLFVCTANICRSAYAEVRSRQMLGLDAGWAFFSAGVRWRVAWPWRTAWLCVHAKCVKVFCVAHA